MSKGSPVYLAANERFSNVTGDVTSHFPLRDSSLVTVAFIVFDDDQAQKGRPYRLDLQQRTEKRRQIKHERRRRSVIYQLPPLVPALSHNPTSVDCLPILFVR